MNAVELKGVGKHFGDHVIFNGFNLEVKEGEMVALTGSSGCGKSTLLNIIGLLESANSGDVIIKGAKGIKPNGKKATLLQRGTIGYLFQNYALVDNMTVDKNLDIALEYLKENKEKKNALKKEALKKVGVSDKLNSKVYELSGGEQQRAAIARLMLKPCDIILADEPTGSLDTDNRDVVIGLLKELNKAGKTIILATHDKAVADVCDRVISL